MNRHQFAKPLSTLELKKKTVMKHSKSLYHCVWSHGIKKQVTISLCLELSQNRKIQKENIVHWTGVSRVSRDNMHLRKEYLEISSTRVSMEVTLWIRFFHLWPSQSYCHHNTYHHADRHREKPAADYYWPAQTWSDGAALDLVWFLFWELLNYCCRSYWWLKTNSSIIMTYTLIYDDCPTF